MSASLDLLVPALGWVLLNFIWQGALIGLATALLLALLARARPQLRYALLALALLACLLLPAWQLLRLLGHGAAPLPLAEREQLALAIGEAPGWLWQLKAALPALVAAWSAGVGLMGLRLALGLAWLRQLRRLPALPAGDWPQRMALLAQHLGLRRAVGLRVVEGISSPLTLGWIRPLVLLPAAVLSGLPAPLVEALIAHELAHVRRLDYLVNLLQSLIEALLFFHPVVWWLSSRLRRERELVADAIAADLLQAPRQMAQALHALAQLADTLPAKASRPELSLAAHGGDLLNRVHSLMLKEVPHRSSGLKLALPTLLLALSGLLLHAQVNAAQRQPQQRAAGEIKPADDNANALSLPVNAKHALVLEESTGRVLMEKNADAVVPIASLTKLVTAMVVLDAKPDMNEKIRVSNEDVDTLKHSASRLKVGAEVSRMAALKMALMQSENRAASALARTYPGGLAAFTQAVHAKLKALGLSRTVIQEPTGLSPENVSTATEVAKITAAAARYAQISEITSDKKDVVPVNGKPREVHNTNRLVGAKGWDIRLSKTGYTEEAGRCLTMRMISGGKPVTVVLLDADGSAQRLRDAAKIRQSLNKLHS